jgi:exopolysaccharide production protein ExoQ
MRELSTHLSRWLLGCSIYLTGWYYEGPALQAAQMGAISLLLMAGFFSVLSGDTLRIRPSPVEWLFSTAFLFAMAVAWATGNVLSTMYGAMLLLVLTALALVIRHHRASGLVAVFRWAYVALIATLLLVEPQALFASLAGSVEYGQGLIRYQPLGMHPNLSGLVYGGGALLFFQHCLAVRRRPQQLFALAMAGLCLCVLLAASARAGMLALAVTGLTGVTLITLRGSRRARIGLLLAALAGLELIVFKWADIRDYLSLILDVDSPTRGVESGATGRTDLWQAGVELVFSDGALAFTGRGIRSALPEIIGFPVESSYINMALEHGLFFGSLMVLAFAVTAGRALQRGLPAGQPQYPVFMAGLMLVFILAQSVFNRYLIGVGNPYSLWALVLVLQLNLPVLASGTRANARHSPPFPWPTGREAFVPPTTTRMGA